MKQLLKEYLGAVIGIIVCLLILIVMGTCGCEPDDFSETDLYGDKRGIEWDSNVLADTNGAVVLDWENQEMWLDCWRCGSHKTFGEDCRNCGYNETN